MNHAVFPYDLHHKEEAGFQNIFYAIFKLLGCSITAGSRTSDGRIEAMVETDQQKITLVGANFDTETGKLSGRKNEEVQ